ncbi:MAG TPA: hypothetical protein VGM76_11010 [Lacipirellulaceae bacterium]|jgi:hypothetical protein
MQRSLIGVLIGAAFCLIAAAPSFEQSASATQDDQTSGAAGNLITHVSAVEGQPLVVTVIDTSQRAMAVYQVDRQTGEITLKSVRNFTWDLQMKDFNTGKPLPQDIRSGLPK